jgi:hypothetical protein
VERGNAGGNGVVAAAIDVEFGLADTLSQHLGNVEEEVETLLVRQAAEENDARALEPTRLLRLDPCRREYVWDDMNALSAIR